MIVEPGRTIEVACFMRYSLQFNTDRLLVMVRRQSILKFRLKEMPYSRGGAG